MPRPLTGEDRREIQKILSRRTQQLKSTVLAGDPKYQERIEQKCRKLAIGELGVDKELAEIEKLKKQAQAIEDKIQALEQKASRKMPLTEVNPRHSGCATRKTVCQSINDIVEIVRPKVERGDKTGKMISAIDDEHEKSKAALASCITREDVIRAGILS